MSDVGGIADGNSLPDGDHVVRYLKPSLFDNGVIVGDALARRSSEAGVSVNWLECFTPPLDAQLNEVRARTRMTWRERGRLARFEIGVLKRELRRQVATRVDVVAKPLAEDSKFQADPSHAEVMGLPEENTPEAELIRDLVALCVKDVFPAKI